MLVPIQFNFNIMPRKTDPKNATTADKSGNKGIAKSAFLLLSGGNNVAEHFYNFMLSTKSSSFRGKNLINLFECVLQ